MKDFNINFTGGAIVVAKDEAAARELIESMLDVLKGHSPSAFVHVTSIEEGSVREQVDVRAKPLHELT